MRANFVAVRSSSPTPALTAALLLAAVAGAGAGCVDECFGDECSLDLERPDSGAVGPGRPDVGTLPPRDAGPAADATEPVLRPIAFIRAPSIASLGQTIVFDGSESRDPQSLPMAVAPDGTIYFQTRSQLWRIE